MEKSLATRGLPIAKAAYEFLKDNISSTAFTFSGWNKGRIICQRPQLKRLSSSSSKLVSISNLLFPKAGARIYTSDPDNETSVRERTASKREELMAVMPL